MTQNTNTPATPYSSGKFLADYVIRQSKQGGTWSGLTNEHIPTYAQLNS